MLTLTNEEVIKKPLISEKTTWQANSRNAYAFEVDRRADKTQIKKAIEALFNVKVTGVRTIRQHSKTRRTKSGVVSPADWKKAIVELHADNKIDLF